MCARMLSCEGKKGGAELLSIGEKKDNSRVGVLHCIVALPMVYRYHE